MFQNVQILLVEDNLLTAKTLVHTLNNLGYKKVNHANNSDIALEILGKGHTDFIIMDIELKGSKKDGIQLVEQIRKKHQIPTLFLSNHDSDEILERLKNVIDVNFEVKPVSPKNLDFKVKHILKRHTLQEENNEVISLEKSEVFFLKSKQSSAYESVRLAEISHLEANHSGTTIHHGGKESFVYVSLIKMAEKLKHLPLVRTHQKYAVAVNSIESIIDSEVVISDGTRLAIGRTFRQPLKHRLQELLIST